MYVKVRVNKIEKNIFIYEICVEQPFVLSVASSAPNISFSIVPKLLLTLLLVPLETFSMGELVRSEIGTDMELSNIGIMTPLGLFPPRRSRAPLGGLAFVDAAAVILSSSVNTLRAIRIRRRSDDRRMPEVAFIVVSAVVDPKNMFRTSSTSPTCWNAS